MTKTQRSSAAACPASFGLIPIPLATLAAAPLHVDLYLKPEAGQKPVLYRERNYPLEGDDVERLLRTETQSLYVEESEYSHYQSYLRENLGMFLADEQMAPERRLTFLVEAAQDMLREAFVKKDSDGKVNTAQEIAAYMAGLLTHQDLRSRKVFGLVHHDDPGSVHSTNVTIYGVMLARKLGIRDAKTLEEIAAGCLLHDVGQYTVPAVILLKKGPLNKKERALLERHPQTGFEALCRRRDLTWGQLMMVYQHHERLDGRGYPVQVPQNEIHEFARLCAVADVFDALSSKRPYRRALPLSEALGFLKRQAGRGLDKEMVRCWTTMMTCRS